MTQAEPYTDSENNESLMKIAKPKENENGENNISRNHWINVSRRKTAK